ncbi:MAG: hypothetical protein AAGC68_11430, partial [Verrucomicrobiota bacterium]
LHVSMNAARTGSSNGSAIDPSISADGSRIAYESLATNTVANDTDTIQDIYVFNANTEVTILASVNDSAEKADARVSISRGALSADGTKLVMATGATNFGGQSGTENLYLRDLVMQTNEVLANTNDGAGPNQAIKSPKLSADGTTAVFSSEASNLVNLDANGGFEDIFASPGADLTPAPVVVAATNALELAKQKKKLKKLQKSLKKARRNGQTTKVRSLLKKIKKTKKKIKSL